MKSLVLLAVLFASAQVLATPKVGDKSQYAGSGTVAGNPITFTSTLEITDYQAAADKYKVVETTVLNSLPDSEPYLKESWVGPDKLFSDAELDHVVTHCAEEGGTPEQLTVKAGTFDTCKFSNTSVTVHYGKVPFGLIQQANETVKAELESYSTK